MIQAIPWYEADLKQRLRLGVDYTCRIMNPENENIPYFAYGRRAEDGTAYGHGDHPDFPHAIGRAMDLLLNYEKCTKEGIPKEAEEAYFRNFYNNLDDELCMCTAPNPTLNKKLIIMHNVRETTEALGLLIEVRKDERARQCADKLLAGLTLITDPESGNFTLPLAEKSGIDWRFWPYTLQMPQTQGAGRLTGPLMAIYRVTGDDRALTLAGYYAKGTLSCFTDEGIMKKEAGTHIHSTTSSLSGAAEYAWFIKDMEMVSKLENIFNHPEGMPKVMSSYGWIKEQIDVPDTYQGEANQIGDMISFALTMGMHKEPAFWYERAETFLRSALLPSQVLDAGIINETEEPTGDVNRNMKQRIIGGWGFPMPSTHLETAGSALNTLDIAQGACQSICRSVEHIAVADENGVRINLLFSTSNDWVEIDSKLPVSGDITIAVKADMKLSVRKPANLFDDSLSVSVNGEKAAYMVADGYIVLDGLKKGAVVNIGFQPRLTERKEVILDIEHTVTYFGEQVVFVSPIKGLYPLYTGFPIPSNKVF